MKSNCIIITPFSYTSKCGIWERAASDVFVLKKQGYEVNVFSSNIKKGTTEILSNKEEYKGVKIFRFSVKLRPLGNSMFFFFLKNLRELNPDIIHVHGYRHPHCIQALFWAKLNKKKIILTTHGPFRKDSRRPFLHKLVDIIYDVFIGFWELRLYDQVIAVSKWELPFLIKRNASRDKISVIPNSINDEFFKINPRARQSFNNILYMGRVEKIKRIEWLIELAKKFPNLNFTIFGPDQDNSLNNILKVKNLKIINKEYGIDDFINESKKNDIFILPSVRESFGIVGLEAMSQGLLLISSNTLGVKEYLINKKNGIIVNSFDELVISIKNLNSDLVNEMIRNGIKTAKNYSVEKNSQKLLKIYTKFTSSC